MQKWLYTFGQTSRYCVNDQKSLILELFEKSDINHWTCVYFNKGNVRGIFSCIENKWEQSNWFPDNFSDKPYLIYFPVSFSGLEL